MPTDLETVKAAFSRDPVAGTAAIANILGKNHGVVTVDYVSPRVGAGKPFRVTIPKMETADLVKIGRIYQTAIVAQMIGRDGKARKDLERERDWLNQALVSNLGSPEQDQAFLWDQIFRAAIAMKAAGGSRNTADMIFEALAQSGAEAPVTIIKAIATATEETLKWGARTAGKTLKAFGLGGGLTTIVIGLGLLWLLTQQKGR